MFCTSCGKQLDDNAKFCIYCGAQLSVSEEHVDTKSDAKRSAAKDNDETKITVERDEPVAPPPAPAPAQPKEKKPIDYAKLSQVFFILYVLSGAAVFFLDGIMMPASLMYANGFSVFIGIIMLFVAAFNLFVTIFRFVAYLKSSPEERAKNRTREIICFVIGIMLFLFAFISSILCFGVYARVHK